MKVLTHYAYKGDDKPKVSAIEPNFNGFNVVRVFTKHRLILKMAWGDDGQKLTISSNNISRDFINSLLTIG